MAVMVQEPLDNNPMTEDWQRFLFRTTFQGGGFIQLMLTNLNTAQVPQIARGSRLEVNGTFYSVPENETIEGATSSNRWIFVYAVTLSNSVVFEYSEIFPVWDTMKNGYYSSSGNARAVAKAWRGADGWFSKVVLETYESMFTDNFSVLSNTGGTSVMVSTVGGITQWLAPGAYRFEIRGGQGGRGGANADGTRPPVPAMPVANNNRFFLEKGSFVYGVAGRGGGDGGDAVGNARFAGGGGASGGTSFLVIMNNRIESARGGIATAGQNASGGTPPGTGGAAGIQEPERRSELNLETMSLLGLFFGGQNLGSPGIPGGGSGTGSNGSGGVSNTARNGWARVFRIWETINRNQIEII